MKKQSTFFSVLVTSTALAFTAQAAPYSNTLNEERAQVHAMTYPSETHTMDKQPAALPASPPNRGTVTMVVREPADIPPPDRMIQSQGGGAIPSLPLQAQRSESGIPYITGGVGDEELAQLKSLDSQYNLQVLAAASSGAYLSGMTIRIMDEDGREVLTAQPVGPYFYTQLTPGRYNVQMQNRNGETETASVRVDNGSAAKPIVRFNNAAQ